MSEVRHDIAELNQLFSEGETADKEIFAEMRSNIQLVAGEHYTRKGNKFWNRLRDTKDITQEQKIRLTKNHIRKISQIYKNSITSYAPGVTAEPKDKSSVQHQKSAELKNAVWEDAKARQNINQKINQWASDYIDIGECYVKIYFDPNAGKFLGEEAKLDENGQVEMDENGQPVSSGTAKFVGDVVLERLFGFNIIRPKGCKDIFSAEWLAHRKMVETKDIKALIDASTVLSDQEKEELKQKVTDSPDQTYTVLDGNTGSYMTVKGQTMLKEWYFRPCPQYPKGYFYLAVESSKLFEGELPFGIFPIIGAGFDQIPTSPRSRSIIKQLRPYQVEINRCASKMAEHQITLGDDKILVQNGTKLVPGIALPGVRSFQYSGMQPIVMEGRTGEQYLSYMNSQISEIYQVANVEEVQAEKGGQFDVYAMLFRSIKDKKKFSYYTDTFESYLKLIFKTHSSLCQNYYTDQHLIPAIGKSEYINISEFKDIGELDDVAVIEAQTDDGETKLGKQLMLQHLIQYVGPQLAKDDLGKIIRLMPYSNDEQILEDLTMDYDQATNYILALDRGEVPQPNEYDAHEYLIKKLVNRTRQPDYMFLNDQIKQNYEQAISTHQEMKTEQEMKIKQAQSEFIPTGGFLVACDFYTPDPGNPEKLPKRVRIPSEAIDWLMKQLQSQGSDQQTLDNMNKGALAQMSTMIMQKIASQRGVSGQPMAQQMPQQSMMPQQYGQTSPGRM
jgi:hypothetical protein